MRYIIVATDSDGNIGKNNELLISTKEDMTLFINMTLKFIPTFYKKPAIVVMGRKTLESIGHPLYGRKNIIISKHANSSKVINDYINYSDKTTSVIVKSEFNKDTVPDDCVIIGGSSIYKSAISSGIADVAIVTIYEDFHNNDADSSFTLSNEWNPIADIPLKTGNLEKDGYSKSHVVVYINSNNLCKRL